MSNNFYLYIVLALIFSFIMAAFQYIYKNTDKTITPKFLFVLRFFSIFSLLLLFINPKIKTSEVEIIKPSLVVAVDNSKSILNLKEGKNTKELVHKLITNSELQKKFKIDYYTFSDKLSLTDSLKFNKNTTNLTNTLYNLNKIYKKSIAPTILITDGNQTHGEDYTTIKLKQSIYPIVVGDTTEYQDVYLSQLNVNKYAYLKNKFPVELFVNYKGKKPINIKLIISEGKTTVFSKNIKLNATKKSERISFFLKANSVGLHTYKVKIGALSKEKNTQNNRKSFTIEVINEQSKVVIISDILHPDIAMLKRSIESNKQRKVFLKKPSDLIKIDDYQLFILYQPTISFKDVFSKLNKFNKNVFIITGVNTNWKYLNNAQNYFNKKAITTTESYLANYNTAYNTFLTEDLGFENFQPIDDFFGKVTFSVPYQSLLFQKIGTINSEEPLFATFEQNGRRGALLLGENIWRWRLTSKMESKSFQPFDSFINKTIQYLVSNKKSNYLEVTTKKYFYQNESIKINSKYYNANYEFDPNEKLWVNVINKQTKKQIKYPFALFNNNYEVNISELNSGNYSFKVYSELNKNVYYGNFIVLDYDIEQQFTSANKKSLEKLAKNTNGNLFFNKDVPKLIDQLIKDEKYVSIQKIKEILTPLIDWKWILGVIILLLSLEWFIRKYKGYV